GLNSSGGESDTFVSDHALDMPLPLFRAHKVTSFIEVRTALERLLGYRELRTEVPELDEWAAGTINVSDLGITTLTPRVRALLEHPLVYRLTEQRQLGLLDTVFPTATHTRFQHSLGVYHAVGRYVTALYFDPENPTFRVLFSPADCAAALVATIVHDVGHTAFGHDLEEVDDEEFSHSKIGRAMLDEPDERDIKGRTITDLITAHESDCWGLSLERARRLLHGEPELPVDSLYHDMLDGQLDADKLDYLMRDSVETRVQYGHGIDHERFLRSLTTTVDEEAKVASVRLAIRQKGAASAEAFAFARYQLYQALYWHHTFRAVKAMLLTAAAGVVADLRRHPPADLFEKHPLRNAYVSFVIRGKQPAYTQPQRTRKRGSSTTEGARETIEGEIAKRLNTRGAPPNAKFGSRDKTLLFLWRLSEGKNAELLEDLMTRRYYKRVLELPLSDFADPSAVSNLLTHKRVEFHERLETALLGALTRAIQDQSVTRESLREDEALTQVSDTAQKRHIFLLDLPLRGWSSAGGPPPFVSDYKRRHFRSGVGIHQMDGDTLWTRQLRDMMMRVAFFRVFCEPTVHQILTRVMDVSDVLTAFKKEFRELEIRRAT
ncbi:MAG: HD domain-containing protein, partial [Thermoanaerobaculia bacterium]